MDYMDTLSLFGLILTEAEGQENAKKETDLERARRIIEERLCDYFTMAGCKVDASDRTIPDARLDGNTEPPPEGYRLSEFIRLWITSRLLHPPSEGGWGIGDSRPAIENLRTMQQNKGDRSLRGIGSSGNSLTPESLKSPDKYPEQLRNYISALSAKYMLGMVRIGMEECGLLPYTLYNKREILDSVLQPGHPINDEETLKSMIPPDWDFEKLYHLSHIIIPQFILKLLIAPSAPTPNCNPALIAQNEAYLGDDLRVIQAYVTPIDDLPEINANLQVKGSATPATYNDMARYAAAWNFSVSDIKKKASHDTNGRELTYTPPDDTEIPQDLGTESEEDDSLHVTYASEAGYDGTHQYRDATGRTCREYPSQKVGDWYIVDVDNDTRHRSQNVSLLSNGYTVLEDDSGEQYKFWFQGGRGNSVDNSNGHRNRGVYPWCWIWGHYNDYCKAEYGDRGYMILSKRISDPDIIQYTPRNGRDSENNGTPYDSSAFGIVVAGPENPYGIPGLVKPTCIQGRNDMTDGAYRPGDEEAVHYDSSLVPHGGEIPGLIKYGGWLDDDKRKVAACINNSIFSLALIGKWDGSIKVSNGKTNDREVEMYPDRILPLMQKWFPVDKGDSGTRALTHEKKITLNTIGDKGTLGKILASFITTENTDESLSSLLLNVFKMGDGNVWHVLDIKKDDAGRVIGFVLTHADEEFRLRTARSGGKINESRYDNAIGELPAMLYTRNDDGRFIPLPDDDLTVGKANRLLEMWTDNRERPLHERVGDWTDDEPADAQETQDRQIVWAPTMKSSGKNRKIGVGSNGEVCISGPETGNETVALFTDKTVAEFLLAHALRGTYITTEKGDHNIWITATGERESSESEMYILYVRKGRCKMFKMSGSVIGNDTPNAILTDGNRVVLGNLLGDLARMNRQNSDRYTMFLDMSSLNEYGRGSMIDGAGIYIAELREMAQTFHGCVGLAVSNGRADFNQGEDTVVGVMDWYNADTLEFVRTTEITLGMIPKAPGRLPRETIL